MRRVSWLAAILVLGVGVSAWADCGCTSGLEPSCYATFRSNELISFSLTVPVDYFTSKNTAETPMISGWRVEALDGTLIRSVAFGEVKGHWSTFLWDLTDDAGNVVAGGFYRIIVMTTSAGEIGTDVRLVSCCNPCSTCWSCDPCSASVDGRIRRCPTACGSPYIVMESGGTRSCCGFTFHVFGSVETPSP